MNLSAFKSLCGSKKFEAIEKHGQMVAERKIEFCSVTLFQIADFYVEVYKHQHFNVVVKMRSFEDTSLLEPYLQQIDIADLSLVAFL